MSYNASHLGRMEALRARILAFVAANPECFFVQIKFDCMPDATPHQIAGAVSCMVKAGELRSVGEARNEKRFIAVAEDTESAADKLARRRANNAAADARRGQREAAPQTDRTDDAAEPWRIVHRAGDTHSRGQGAVRQRVYVNCSHLY